MNNFIFRIDVQGQTDFLGRREEYLCGPLLSGIYLDRSEKLVPVFLFEQKQQYEQ